MAINFLTDVDIFIGDAAIGAASATGWALNSVDLNKGCGADTPTIKLGYKLSADLSNAIRSLHIREKPEPIPGGYTEIPKDLNKGAGGATLTLCYSKVFGIGGPITDVAVTANEHHIPAAPGPDWVQLRPECNRGAGGWYVTICYRRST